MLPIFRPDTEMVTRGHSLKLKKRDCRTEKRANTLGFRIVNGWNALPEEVVKAGSVNEFKGRFDRCCSLKRFSVDTDKFI